MKIGTPFSDRVAIGAYNSDIHSLKGCNYSSYIYSGYQSLPYFIPFRALTNKDFDNLIVSGKNMA